VSLYLLSTTALTLDPAMPLRFRLSGLGADGANGTRGTQVALRYRLRFPDVRLRVGVPAQAGTAGRAGPRR
jgi:hypothetical protein